MRRALHATSGPQGWRAAAVVLALTCGNGTVTTVLTARGRAVTLDIWA